MATTASRAIQLVFSGDVPIPPFNQSALDNVASPAQIDIVTLALGDNTITPPSVSGVTTAALTILPPTGNVNLIKLKQTGTDAGVPIHKTDPTSIGLDTTFTTLVLNAAAQIVGLRLIWS